MKWIAFLLKYSIGSQSRRQSELIQIFEDSKSMKGSFKLTLSSRREFWFMAIIEVDYSNLRNWKDKNVKNSGKMTCQLDQEDWSTRSKLPRSREVERFIIWVVTTHWVLSSGINWVVLEKLDTHNQPKFSAWILSLWSETRISHSESLRAQLK